MSRIPISSLANGVLFAIEPFASPSNPAGTPVLTPAAGSQCAVYVHDSATPALVYATETAVTPMAQPLVSDATGTIPGWIDPLTLPLDLAVATPAGAETFVLYASTGPTGATGPAIVLSAADATVVVGGTSTAPTVKVAPGTFDAAGAATAAAAASIPVTQKGASGGVASLTGTVLTASQVPPTVVTGASRTATAQTTILASDHVLLVDASSAAFSQPLPTAVGFTGRYTISAITIGPNLVTLTTTGGQTIIPPGGTGLSTLTLGSPTSGAPYTSVDLVSDGVNWRIA